MPRVSIWSLVAAWSVMVRHRLFRRAVGEWRWMHVS